MKTKGKEAINIECCREGSKQEAPLEWSLEGGGLPEEAKLEKKNDIQPVGRERGKVQRWGLMQCLGNGQAG